MDLKYLICGDLGRSQARNHSELVRFFHLCKRDHLAGKAGRKVLYVYVNPFNSQV